MTKAIIKFNGGAGALLCNGCRVILLTGFDHDPTTQYFCFGCAGEIARQRANKKGDSPEGKPP